MKEKIIWRIEEGEDNEELNSFFYKNILFVRIQCFNGSNNIMKTVKAGGFKEFKLSHVSQLKFQHIFKVMGNKLQTEDWFF